MAIPNPYVGPQPFSQDQPLFGREREVQELRGLITSERIVLLYSPSGAGKSSLVNAGLIPQLRKRFDIWGPTRVNTQPPPGVGNRFVWSMIAGLAGTDLNADVTLAQYAAKRPRQRNPLIIVDQFEEILRIDPMDAERKRNFFGQLGDLLSDPSIWALLILREDYLAPLDPYARLIPTHLQNRYRLDRLTREGAEHAIGRPAERCPRRYADGVVEALVTNLATVKVTGLDGKTEERVGEYVEPLQLQVVCFDLWSRMERDHPDDMLIEQHDIGDVSGALRSYYDNAVHAAASLDSEGNYDESAYDVARERSVREWFKLRMITPDGVRNQVRHEAVRSGGLENDSIKYLLDAYLVRAEPRGSSVWYELAHDRLVAPVQESNTAWLDAHLNKVQRTAQLWISEGRKSALLLTGADLEDALAEAQGIKLQPEEEEFVAACRELQAEEESKAQAALREKKQAEREKEQAERIRKTNMILRVAFALALVAVVVAVWKWIAAARDEQVARDSQAFALTEAKAASGAAGEARLQRANALIAAEAASGAAGEARREADHAQQALEATNSAIVRFFAEKAKSADTHADLTGSGEDSQTAWMYALAALDKSHRGGAEVAEVAGLLLWPDFYPSYKETAEEKVSAGAQGTLEHAFSIPGTGRVLYSARVGPAASQEAKPSSRIVCYARPAPPPVASQARPAQASCPVFAVLPGAGANGRVDAIAVDESGKLAAVGYHGFSDPNQPPPQGVAIRFAEGKPPSFQATDEPVGALTFAGNYVAAGTTGGNLLLFGLSESGIGLVARSACPQKAGQCSPLRALAWSGPGDSMLAAGYDDGSVHLYRIASGKPDKRAVALRETGLGLTAHTAGITSLAFWPGTSLIVTGHSDGTVRIVERSGELRATSHLHDEAVIALSFDDDAHTLVNLSADGDLHRTALFPEAFGVSWDLKKLLSGESGRDLRHQLLRKSAIALGYADIGEGAADDTKLAMTDAARAAGKSFFGIDATRETHFTMGEDLLVRPVLPETTLQYPRISGDVISLMPDHTAGARSVVMHKRDLKGAFKAEFEYRMRSPGASANLLGDGFVFMFYKDRTPYEAGTTGTPQFGFEFGNGYGIVFNSYYYRSGGVGIRFYNPSTPDDDHPRGRVSLSGYQMISSSPTDWKKVCIEVNPGPGEIKPLCADDKGASFFGEKTYLNGSIVSLQILPMPATAPASLATQMVMDFGGFGFAGATGQAMEEQTIRNVKITRVGSAAADPELLFRGDNTITLARLGNDAVKSIDVRQPTYPVFASDKLILTGDGRFDQSTAVLLKSPGKIQQNYAVDFEYSIHNAGSTDPTFTGYGIVAMFGKDPKVYAAAPEAKQLPATADRSYLPDTTGFGVRFNVQGKRSIDLLDNRGKKMSVTEFRSSLGNLYTDGQWRRVRVEVSRTDNTLRVIYEGVEVLNEHLDMSKMTDSIGFAAATGTEASGITAEQAVRNVVYSEIGQRKHHN